MDDFADLIHHCPLSHRPKGDNISPPEGLSTLFTTSKEGATGKKFGRGSEGYLQGYSFVVSNSDRLGDASLPSVLSRAIGKLVGVPGCYSQVYCTPPFGAKAAVGMHNDDRDVFVVQALGKKQWYAYDNDRTGIGGYERWPDFKGQLGKDGRDFEVDTEGARANEMNGREIEEGDVLYIPRGGVHWAANSGEQAR